MRNRKVIIKKPLEDNAVPNDTEARIELLKIALELTKLAHRGKDGSPSHKVLSDFADAVKAVKEQADSLR